MQPIDKEKELKNSEGARLINGSFNKRPLPRPSQMLSLE